MSIETTRQTTYPIPMSSICSDAITGRYFPHFDRLVPTAGHHKVACWYESDTGHAVVMTEHGTNAFEALLEVPKLDAHVRTAGHLHINNSVYLINPFRPKFHQNRINRFLL